MDQLKFPKSHTEPSGCAWGLFLKLMESAACFQMARYVIPWFSSFLLQYSLCNEPLIELSNPGASGSLFFVTSDDEFIIKTVQHKEAEFLQKLLPGYYMVSSCT